MGLDGFFVLVRVEIWDKTIQDYAYADILFIQQLFSRSLELELNFSAIRLGFPLQDYKYLRTCIST